METTSDELQKLANKILDETFQGVFPLDLLPRKKSTNTMFIINTDTSNLPGSHWIAVVVRNNEAYCFDPLGFPPPLKLAYWMNQHATK